MARLLDVYIKVMSAKSEDLGKIRREADYS
jgi:hypothetical protein